MKPPTSAPVRVMLYGEWTMTQAAERLHLLTDAAASQLKAEPKPVRAEIDLSSVSEVDACGCQLLAVFLEHLKRHDILPSPCGIGPGVMDSIRLLGFAGALCGESAPEEENR